MKKLLISIAISSSFLFAQNEIVNIEDEDVFFKNIYEKFNFESQNHKYNMNIKVLVSINEKGEMDYKITKMSDIPKFNMDVLNILKENQKTIFPTLKNKKVKFEFDFEAININERPKLKNIKEL